MKTKFSLIILPDDVYKDDSENTRAKLTASIQKSYQCEYVALSQMVLKHLVPSSNAQDASYCLVNVLRHRWLH